MRSYADALHVVENAKDQDSGWKALNPNRKSDSSKRVRQDGAVVTFRLHHTDVVKWHSPDHIEIEYFDSLSTAVFIDRLTPLTPMMHRRKLYVESVQPANGKSVSFYCEHGVWKPDEGDVLTKYTYRVNRKRAAEVRKIINPIIEFRQALCALRPDMTSRGGSVSVVQEILHSPPKDDQELVRLIPRLPPDRELYELAMAFRAVEKVELPFGTMPEKTRWDRLAHFI